MAAGSGNSTQRLIETAVTNLKARGAVPVRLKRRAGRSTWWCEMERVIPNAWWKESHWVSLRTRDERVARQRFDAIKTGFDDPA
jgi:hypothetical protein